MRSRVGEKLSFFSKIHIRHFNYYSNISTQMNFIFHIHIKHPTIFFNIKKFPSAGKRALFFIYWEKPIKLKNQWKNIGRYLFDLENFVGNLQDYGIKLWVMRVSTEISSFFIREGNRLEIEGWFDLRGLKDYI
jgi:hypothetical protein